jgi:hypothetical protein
MAKNNGSSLSIFNTERAEDPVTVLRETLSIVQGDDGEVYVAFTTNRGKGSGLQYVRASEFVGLLAEFRKVADEGIPERDGSQSAVEVFHRTIANDEGTLSFRLTDGKGAKPAKVDAAAFPKVVAVLEKAWPAIQKAISDFAEIE